MSGYVQIVWMKNPDKFVYSYHLPYNVCTFIQHERVLTFQTVSIQYNKFTYSHYESKNEISLGLLLVQVQLRTLETVSLHGQPRTQFIGSWLNIQYFINSMECVLTFRKLKKNIQT